jgi:hypothetical protein
VDSTVKYKTFCNLTEHSDGKTYVQPYDYDLAFDPKTGMMYFGNLFNGNKLLGEISSAYHYISKLCLLQRVKVISI